MGAGDSRSDKGNACSGSRPLGRDGESPGTDVAVSNGEYSDTGPVTLTIPYIFGGIPWVSDGSAWREFVILFFKEIPDN